MGSGDYARGGGTSGAIARDRRVATSAALAPVVAGPTAAVRNVAGTTDAPATQPGMAWQSPGGIRSSQGGGTHSPSSMHEMVADDAICPFTISGESVDGAPMFIEASWCTSHAPPNPVSENGMNAA